MARVIGSLRSVERGLALLELLSESPEGLRLKDLARAAVLPESTAHRLMQTLTLLGYTYRNSDSDIYHLTPKLYNMGRSVQGEAGLIVVAGPYLNELRNLTHETTHLAVLSGLQVETVASVLSDEKNVVASPVGEKHPLHASAVGKCLVAYADADVTRSITERCDFAAYTSKTITSANAFRAELAAVRKHGYALDLDEFEEGIRCAAAPILNHRGDVVVSVGISGPSVRLTDQRIQELASILVEVADRISHAVGAR